MPPSSDSRGWGRTLPLRMRSCYGIGHAAVEPLFVIRHASASEVVLADGLNYARPAYLAVGGPSACSAVITHVLALLAPAGVAVLVKICLVKPHTAYGCRGAVGTAGP